MQSPDKRTSTPQGPARCLHLVAGAGREALADCLPHVDPTDTVLFLDAGVLHLLRAAADSPGGPAAAVCFAEADLRAHGLLELARRVQAVTLDDAGFCELLAVHEHCLTWR